MTDVRANVSAIKATLLHLATKADLGALETRMIRWIVGTAISLIVAMCAIERYL